MQVSFNPVKYNNIPFKSYSYTDKGREYIPSPPTKDEIRTAKTKRVVSELKYIIIGILMLYFATKRKLKYNKIEQIEKQKAELAKLSAPVAQLMDVNINASKFLGG